MDARPSHAPGQPRSVVSVSPHQSHDHIQQTFAGDEGTQPAASAMNLHAAALYEAVARAEVVLAQAQAAIAELQMDQSQAEQASLQLHEQLVTGARLLQAGQIQLGQSERDMQSLQRLHQSAADIASGIQSQLFEFENCGNAVVQRVATNVGELLNRALSAVEQSLDRRCALLEHLEGRLNRAADRLSNAVSVIESPRTTQPPRIAGPTPGLRRDLPLQGDESGLGAAGGEEISSIPEADPLPALRLQTWASGG